MKYSWKKRILAVGMAAALAATATIASFPAMATDSQTTALANSFKDPGSDYRPKVRWWWPGGDVQVDELLREMQVLYDNGFGGVEIQPFDYSLKPEATSDPNSPVKDFGTEEFFEKVRAVLDFAREKGMTVDLNMGSGYCAGADFVPLEDNEQTLMSADVVVNSDQINAAIPKLSDKNYMYELFDPNNNDSTIKPGWRTMNYHPETAKLITLLAAKVMDGERNPDYTVLNDTVTLDMTSVEKITDFNKETGTFNWTCPDPSAQWQIIAVYSMYVGSNPIGSVEVGAPGEESYMVNVLDADAVARYYDNWLEQIKTLLPYTEDGTLRAAFNDSYEFFAQRIYSDTVLEDFKEINGYDITDYTPALLMPGKDQIASFFVGNRAPEFAFEDTENAGINDRLNYDYNRAVANGFYDGWYTGSQEALKDTGLLFRQQGYNTPMDIIKATSMEDIPETEQSNVANNKVVSSGAHFYDKNMVSCESMVFYVDEDGAGNFKMTPEVYRQQADQILSSGVNEMIYHGFPYVYNDETNSYGVQNWSAFCSGYSGYDISTTISEADPYFNYINSLNDYVARLQYLFREGKSTADVLVYLPLFADETSAQFAPVINALDDAGLAWDWINEELIESATYDNGIIVNGKTYDALVLPDVSSIPVSTMTAIDQLSSAGAPIAIYGTTPYMQPSYSAGDYAAQDAIVANLAQAMITRENSPSFDDAAQMAAFVKENSNPEITYDTNQNLAAMRRDLGNNGQLIFVTNDSNEATPVTFHLDSSLTTAYVLDARTGEIYEVPVVNGTVQGEVTAKGSIVLIGASSEVFTKADLSKGNPIAPDEPVATTNLDQWTLTVTGQDVNGTYTATGEQALTNWRDNPTLKYNADPGVYTTTFNLDKVDPTQDYILQLGTLYGVPEISVNGSEAIAVPMAPYQLDISQYLKPGENTISIQLVVGIRNRLIKYGLEGEDGNGQNQQAYLQFASATPVKLGMVEPAQLIQIQTDRVVDDTSSGSTSEPSTPSDTSSNSSTSSNPADNLPQTGDVAPLIGILTLLGATSAALVISKRKK